MNIVHCMPRSRRVDAADNSVNYNDLTNEPVGYMPQREDARDAPGVDEACQESCLRSATLVLIGGSFVPATGAIERRDSTVSVARALCAMTGGVAKFVPVDAGGRGQGLHKIPSIACTSL